MFGEAQDKDQQYWIVKGFTTLCQVIYMTNVEKSA